MTISAFGTITIRALLLASIPAMILRFSFNRYVATLTGVIALISALRSFCASSSTKRRIDKAIDFVERILP